MKFSCRAIDHSIQSALSFASTEVKNEMEKEQQKENWGQQHTESLSLLKDPKSRRNHHLLIFTANVTFDTLRQVKRQSLAWK